MTGSKEICGVMLNCERGQDVRKYPGDIKAPSDVSLRLGRSFPPNFRVGYDGKRHLILRSLAKAHGKSL